MPFTTCRLPLAACLPFAVIHLPLTACRLPRAVYHVPFTTCHLPKKGSDSLLTRATYQKKDLIIYWGGSLSKNAASYSASLRNVSFNNPITRRPMFAKLRIEALGGLRDATFPATAEAGARAGDGLPPLAGYHPSAASLSPASLHDGDGRPSTFYGLPAGRLIGLCTSHPDSYSEEVHVYVYVCLSLYVHMCTCVCAASWLVVFPPRLWLRVRVRA